MKKIAIFLLIIFCFSNQTFCEENKQVEQYQSERMAGVGFSQFFDSDNKQEILNLFKKHNKYATYHDITKLKSLYADNYLNNDGLDKKVYFDMISKTWELYTDIVYAQEIKDISISENNAIVEVYEQAKGHSVKTEQKIASNGILCLDSLTIYYLKKEGKEWKISAENILYESTTLKYGEAKNLPLTLDAPSYVKAGEKYSIALSSQIPSKAFVIGSITNEPIVFPQKTPEEVFRNIKDDGILERIITANQDGHNEYATCAIGITKTSISENEKINVKVIGMGFIMNRVNI